MSWQKTKKADRPSPLHELAKTLKLLEGSLRKQAAESLEQAEALRKQVQERADGVG